MSSKLRWVVVGCIGLLVMAVVMAAGCKKAGSGDGETKVLDLNEKRMGGGVGGAPQAGGDTR